MDHQTWLKALIQQRQSIRAFTPKQVDAEIIKEILELAARSPSGTNIQPWQVYIVQGDKQQQIIQAVQHVVKESYENPELKKDFQAPFQYYPTQWFEPYLSRRRQNGWGLYQLLGIAKKDKLAMHQHVLRNFEFFGAPVGLFFVAHQELHISAKMAIAMYMQTFMLVAKAYGLDTCAQAAWNDYHRIILPLLNVDTDQQLICGMALGYADENAVINQYYTPRQPLNTYSHFLTHI